MQLSERPLDAQTHLSVELEPKLRLYRRLWLSRVDLEEAKATIDEILRSKIPFPRSKPPNALLMALTTALVVSYARPFINSRGQSAVAERTVPGSLLRVLTSHERMLHDELLEIRNREVAHSDADILELSLKLYSDGEGAILRTARDPIRRVELRAIRRMIEKVEREIENCYEDLRTLLPLGVWL